MAFGLLGRNAVLTRPDPQQAGSVGAPQNLWAKNKSSPGAADGYEFGADDVNEILGQLRGLLSALGGDASGSTGNELAVAMVARLDEKLSIADQLYKGHFDDLAALELAHPIGEAGNWAILLNGSGDAASMAIWDEDNATPEWVDTGVAPASVDWANITSKPATFAPSAHSHAIADVTGLQTALDAKAPAASPVLSGDMTGTHTMTYGKAKQLAASTDLDTVLTPGWYDGSSLTNAPGGSSSWFYIEVMRHSNADTYAVQVARSFNTQQSWVRVRVASVWSSWAEVWTTSNKASIAEYRAGTAAKGLDVATVFGAMAEVTLAYAASLSWDMAAGFDFACSLTGNATLPNPTGGIIPGKRGTIRFAQDATGSRVLTISGGYYRAAGGISSLVLSTAANAVDYLHYRVRSATEIVLSLEKDVKA